MFLCVLFNAVLLSDSKARMLIGRLGRRQLHRRGGCRRCTAFSASRCSRCTCTGTYSIVSAVTSSLGLARFLIIMEALPGTDGKQKEASKSAAWRGVFHGDVFWGVGRRSLGSHGGRTVFLAPVTCGAHIVSGLVIEQARDSEVCVWCGRSFCRSFCVVLRL